MFRVKVLFVCCVTVTVCGDELEAAEVLFPVIGLVLDDLDWSTGPGDTRQSNRITETDRWTGGSSFFNTQRD